MELIAQQVPAAGEWIGSSAAGWTGTTILVFVLYWLLFHHLPSKDKQVTDLITAKDQQAETRDARFTETCKVLTDTFKHETEECRRERREEGELNRQSRQDASDKLAEAIAEIREVAIGRK